MKVSKEFFNLFKEECYKWIKFFGLNNWCITFLQDKNITSDTNAWVEIDNDNNMAAIYLNSEWVDNKEFLNDYSIKLIAFHEVCEVLLANMDFTARSRYNISEENIDKARHEVIHILENSIFKEKCNN